ncbi:hypothetical protein [Alkaliphilus sp. B6464]|uniref:hypothetical protein n=1 Tax=Alkaliphilus sp. B6464 TaxID=2731219 RepID=UPI001BAD3FAA|nr:hypothetical protein [Alkaliphilus sp. B6464]QUH21422.1 hypothetical protein HYG84_17055 [Alkaliphilus sp. B6464]
MSKLKKSEEAVKEHRYSKNQFIQSKLYSAIDQDILKIILDNDKKYTKEEVKSELEAFRRKEVK